MPRQQIDPASALTLSRSDVLEDAAADVGAREQAARLSAQLGEDIRPIDPAWRRYAQQGVIVEPHVSRERFKIRMTLSDLGIAFKDKKTAERVERVLAPGHTYLIPKDAAKRIERLGDLSRENASRWGFRTFWGTWIHISSFGRWRDGAPVVEGVERTDQDKGQRELVAEFDREVDALVERYDELCSLAAQAWYSLAVGNWERLNGTPAALEIPNFWDRDAWVWEQVRGLVKRRNEKLPTKEQLRSKFKLWHESWLIPTQEQIQLDLIAAGDRRLEAAEQAMLADLEASARRKVQGGVDQLMTEVRAQVQGQVFETVAVALKVVRGKGGRLGRNSSIALQKMLDSVQDLVFWDEGGNFEANLTELRRILDTPFQKRDGKELEGVLTALGAEARLTLMDLDAERARLAVDADETSLPELALSPEAFGLADELGLGFVRRAVDEPTDDLFDDDALDGYVATVRQAVAKAEAEEARADDDDDDDVGELGAETSPTRQPVLA